MKYSVLGYFIGEGFSNVFKNKKSTGASLMIMCATMIIFGIFLILGENINHFVDQVESEQGIQVFVKNEATQEQIDQLGEDIRKIDGVSTVDFVSKDEALEQMKERFGERQDLLDGYEGENNIFTASYVVTLTDLTKSQEVQDQINTYTDVVKKIQSKDEVVTTLIKEISIMKYVGATNSFIRWPFIVEGMIIGVLASIISIVIVGGAYTFIADKLVSSEFMQLINMSLISFGDMFNSIIFVYMLLGIGIGVLGSMISMRKYLKV